MSRVRQKLSRWHPIGCSFADFASHRLNQNEFAAFRGERRNQWFTFDFPGNLPTWACCYVVYLDGVLSYVGQTENLKSRMQGHLQKRALGPYLTSCTVIIKAKLPRIFGEWAMTELRLIKRLQPPLNRRGIANREEAWS